MQSNTASVAPTPDIEEIEHKAVGTDVLEVSRINNRTLVVSFATYNFCRGTLTITNEDGIAGKPLAFGRIGGEAAVAPYRAKLKNIVQGQNRLG